MKNKNPAAAPAASTAKAASNTSNAPIARAAPNAQNAPAAAAALKYDPGEDYAPRVTAAGSGYLAEKIVDAANEAGVPVYRDKSLAQALIGLRVGEMIPRELYEIVAEVLAYILHVDSGQSRVSAGHIRMSSAGEPETPDD